MVASEDGKPARDNKGTLALLIADRLEIAVQVFAAGPWMSYQGTVAKEWFEEVGAAMGVAYTGEKVRMMRALVERVGGRWDPQTMSSEHTRSKGGGNITREALETLWTSLRHYLATGPTTDEPPSTFEDTPSSTPDRADDVAVDRARIVRRGQPYFRRELLRAYGGRCAVTGCAVTPVLEAAHVVPYSVGGTYATANGVLLRSDIHTLFDLGLLAVSRRHTVLLHPDLDKTEYELYKGNRVSMPRREVDQVPSGAFRLHRIRAGLRDR